MKSNRKSNPTGLYVVKIFDARGHATGDTFTVRKLADALKETASRIDEGGFGFTHDGYFLFPPFGWVQLTGTDSVRDFAKYRMKASAKKIGAKSHAKGKTKLQKAGERMARAGYREREENPSKIVQRAYNLYAGKKKVDRVFYRAGGNKAQRERDVFNMERDNYPGLTKAVEDSMSHRIHAAAMERAEIHNRASARTSNPGDIHIDIQSHNTRGKNVRAKNPNAKIPLLLDSTDHVILTRVLPRTVNFRNTAEGWRADATDAQLRAALPELRANGHRALADDIEAILPKNRKKNHATYRNKSTSPDLKHLFGMKTAYLLKIIRPDKATEYWTGRVGNNWDTEKANALRIDSYDGAVELGKKLARKLPDGYRLEVHDMEENPSKIVQRAYNLYAGKKKVDRVFYRAGGNKAQRERDVFNMERDNYPGLTKAVEDSMSHRIHAAAMERAEGHIRASARASNPGDIHIDIQSHNTRGKNPASFRNKAKPKTVDTRTGKTLSAAAARGRRFFPGAPETRLEYAPAFLVRVVFPDGKKSGWWTGEHPAGGDGAKTGWDTDKKKALRVDSYDSAVRLGKQLAHNLPVGYRVEVHGAGK